MVAAAANSVVLFLMGQSTSKDCFQFTWVIINMYIQKNLIYFILNEVLKLF